MSSPSQNCMNLPPDKVQLLSQYDNEKKWELICDQVGTRTLLPLDALPWPGWGWLERRHCHAAPRAGLVEHVGRCWGAGGICRLWNCPLLDKASQRPMSHEQGRVCPRKSWPVQLGCVTILLLSFLESRCPPSGAGEERESPQGWTSLSYPRGSGQDPCPPFTLGPEELPSTKQLPKVHRLLSGGAGTKTLPHFAQSGAWAATFKAHWLPWPFQLLGCCPW